MTKTGYAGTIPAVTRAKITHLVAAGLLFLAGIWLLVFPEAGATALRYIVGVSCFLIGMAGVIGYFSNDLYGLAFQSDLAFGSFGMVAGVLLMICPYDWRILLPNAVAAYVLMDGMLKLQLAVEGRRFGIRKWPLILATAILLAALSVAMILLSYYRPDPVLWCGIAIAADGAENFWTTMYTVAICQRKKAV